MHRRNSILIPILIAFAGQCMAAERAFTDITTFQGAALLELARCATGGECGLFTSDLVLIEESGADTSLAEGGATDAYSIRLAEQPESDVIVTAAPDSQLLLNGASQSVELIFTSENWQTAQTIDVRAVDDLSNEGLHEATINHSSRSSDSNFDQLRLRSITAQITDNDDAQVLVEESAGATTASELGATDTYTIRLSLEPTAQVDVTITPDADVTVNGSGTPITLSFDSICPGAQCWSTNQTVTVAAVDDATPEGTHTGTITHLPASADPRYNALPSASVNVQIADNDAPGVEVTPTTIAVTEGGASDTYDVRLQSPPANPVTITLAIPGELSSGTASLTFDGTCPGPQCWSTFQTVTVNAVDDAIIEGAHSATVSHTAASADANYNGISVASVTANITDNDSASVVLSTATATATEGGATGSYTVDLSSAPSAAVTVSLSAGSNVSLTPTSLTFDSVCPGAQCWSTPQTVTITAVDDAIAEGAHADTVSHSVSSADADYNGIAVGNVTVNLTDNDTAGVTITESGGNTAVNEGGGTDTYNAVLQSEPTANVTVTVTPPGAQLTANGSAAPVNLTFTPGNYNVAQSVTVQAQDDSIAEGAHNATISHSTTSSDPNYNSLTPASVTAAIGDNDTAGVTIAESGGSTDVAEGGGTDDIQVVLDTEPTANVTVTITPGAGATVNGGAIPINLTFNASCPGATCWSTAQSVTVGALNDAIAEGAHSATISYATTSADLNYNGLVIPGVTVNITDNDTAAVVLTQSGGSTDVVEGGATDAYTIELGTEPLAAVTVTVTPGAEVGAAPTGLTFDNVCPGAQCWSSPQTVTVTANDDSIDEGAHSATLMHAATSVDPDYNGIVIGNVTANISDNDNANVNITESGGTTNVTEDGAGDTISIVLNSEPTGNVTVRVTPDAQGLANGSGTPVTQVFNNTNWNTAWNVNVDASNDAVFEGAHSTGFAIDISASADPNYPTGALTTVTANITDDEVGVVQLAAGASHTCAVLADTPRVRCWGRNNNGQLGYGNMLDLGDDEVAGAGGDISFPSGVSQLVAGAGFNCALLSDGTVHCWGRNGAGQLGLGNNQNIGDDGADAQPGDVALRLDFAGDTNDIARIAAGANHACAVSNGGAIYCWGEEGATGRLGYGPGPSYSLPNNGDDGGETPGSTGPLTTSFLGAPILDVAAGVNFTCVLTDSGPEVWCWGGNNSGALGLGDGDATSIGDDEPIDAARNMAVMLPFTPANSGLAATGGRICMRGNAGEGICWGKNNVGELGLGFAGPDLGLTQTPAAFGSQLNLGANISAFGTGGVGTVQCAIDVSKNLFCWGRGDLGQLGQSATMFGATNNFGDEAGETPDNLPGGSILGNVDQIVNGDGHSCALIGNPGNVVCWGDAAYGQPGYGNTSTVDPPVATNFVSIEEP